MDKYQIESLIGCYAKQSFFVAVFLHNSKNIFKSYCKITEKKTESYLACNLMHQKTPKNDEFLEFWPEYAVF